MSEAGRVIAGSARGTRLVAPDEGTRPMGDRVKQTLFAIIEPGLPGAAVLDLFAGSGGGGIEALSRGAARAVFVERDVTAVKCIGENLTKAHVAQRGHVVKGDAVGYVIDKAAADGPFDFVLVDPPYAETGLMEAALKRLGADQLGREAVVIAKHFWRTPPPESIGLLASFRSKRFGETALTFYRRTDAISGDVDATEVEEPR
jgi:16S rRNA (guanine966-N2)-methyltransferase